MPPRPGELRLWSYQTIAHGADAVVYFRWRTARFGTEQYWHGLLDHDGYAGRRYEEIKTHGRRADQGRASISAARPSNQPWPCSCPTTRALPSRSRPTTRSSVIAEHFRQIYDAFYDHNVAVDIVAPMPTCRAISLVVAPAFHVVSTAAAENLRRFVEAGGVLLAQLRAAASRTSPMPSSISDCPVCSPSCAASRWKNTTP